MNNMEKAPFKMKGAPMQRNFNIGVATKTGVAGLTNGKSPLKIVWLAALAGIAKTMAAKTGAAIAAGAGKVAAGLAATKVGKAVVGAAKTKVGKKLLSTAGSNIISNMLSPPPSKSNNLNKPGANFANMKFGTGGSAFTMKSALKNKPGSGVIDHKKGILDRPVTLEDKVKQKIIPPSIRHLKVKKGKKGILD